MRDPGLRGTKNTPIFGKSAPLVGYLSSVLPTLLSIRRGVILRSGGRSVCSAKFPVGARLNNPIVPQPAGLRCRYRHSRHRRRCSSRSPAPLPLWLRVPRKVRMLLPVSTSRATDSPENETAGGKCSWLDGSSAEAGCVETAGSGDWKAAIRACAVALSDFAPLR